LSHALPLQKISSKSVHKFASNPTDRQTNRQTDRTKNITSFFGGGKKLFVTRCEKTSKCRALWSTHCVWKSFRVRLRNVRPSDGRTEALQPYRARPRFDTLSCDKKNLTRI